MPIDLGQDDDIYEYMAAITHIDTPAQLREKVDRGDVVLNYGLQLVYRTQHTSYATSDCSDNPSDPKTALACAGTGTTREDALPVTPINAFFFQPNVWMKLHYRDLVVELEGTALLGRMDHGGMLLFGNSANNQTSEGNSPAYFRQWGGVIA